MLQEVRDVYQVPREPFRRWFTGKTFDLVVWQGPGHELLGFQLCYHKGSELKALTWRPDRGFSHRTVDDGEGRPFRHKMTPILVPDGVFDRDHILTLFRDDSRSIDPRVAGFVAQTMERYPRDEGV